jgi:hypothetical protein
MVRCPGLAAREWRDGLRQHGHGGHPHRRVGNRGRELVAAPGEQEPEHAAVASDPTTVDQRTSAATEAPEAAVSTASRPAPRGRGGRPTGSLAATGTVASDYPTHIEAMLRSGGVDRQGGERCRGVALGRVGGGAHRGGHERCTGDDEAERDEAGADPERAGADRLVEDEDAAYDRGEVGGH